jgi:peptide deformylase
MSEPAETETGEHEVSELEAELLERREAALAHVVKFGDPVLKSKASPVRDFGPELRAEVERMVSIMRDGMGVGLAATQVGVLRRLFVFEPDEDGPRVIVNPVVAEHGDETETDEEGCLSLPGVRLPVERPTRIVLAGKDENGADVRYELEGYGARVAQHELDHLDGVLIIDRTDDEHRREALASLRPRAVLR